MNKYPRPTQAAARQLASLPTDTTGKDSPPRSKGLYGIAIPVEELMPPVIAHQVYYTRSRFPNAPGNTLQWTINRSHRTPTVTIQSS